MAEITPKRARQHCRRSLAKIDAMLVRMARHWDDLDQTVIDEIDELRAHVEEFGKAMDDAVEYAADRADD
jgi:hypothetical protein